jgi:predicted ester cyclase
MMTTDTAAMATSLDGFHATPAAQRADELVRAFFDAVNADDSAGVDKTLARSFLSYGVHGTRTRNGLKLYLSDLRRSFSGLRFEVDENVGVLAEGDLVALRTLITGTHTGDYAGVPPTGASFQTSASHFFRVRDDQLVEHWPVVDTYRILAAIGAIPLAANTFQQILGVEESPGGLFPETRGTEFGAPAARPMSREETRGVVRRLYDGIMATGRAEDAGMVGKDYIQNSGWTPNGLDAFASAIAVSRGAIPDGLAVQTHMITENNRSASRTLWDGTIAQSGQLADFTTLDFFRLEDGLVEEHWESVDWVRTYQSFGLLSDDVKDA